MKFCSSRLVLALLLSHLTIMFQFVSSWVTTPMTTTRKPVLSSINREINKEIRKSSSSSSCALYMSVGKSNVQQENYDEILKILEEQGIPGDTVGDRKSISSCPENDDLAPLIRTIVKAADGRKGEDIIAMRISKVSTMTSFLVFVTGNSRPQNNAISAAILEEVEETFPGEHKTYGEGVPEGTADSGWMLLDYGSVMVHIMTPRARLYYDLQGQWEIKGGEYMDVNDILVPNKVVVENDEEQDVKEAQLGGSMADLSEEEDPFWS